MFSAHKRFTELLTKDEKDLPNTRVPAERILTLPELKVKKRFNSKTVEVVLCGLLRSRPHSMTRIVRCKTVLTLVLVTVTVQPFQEKNMPCILNI